MKSSRRVDELGMTLLSAPALPSAGDSRMDGSWMDLPSAAAYAGVSFSELARAINRGELQPDTTYGAAPTLLLHRYAVEAWAAARETTYGESLGG
jgi:hypothetical protein